MNCCKIQTKKTKNIILDEAPSKKAECEPDKKSTFCQEDTMSQKQERPTNDTKKKNTPTTSRSECRKCVLFA